MMKQNTNFETLYKRMGSPIEGVQNFVSVDVS